jgi:FkbM family methyltransferase
MSVENLIRTTKYFARIAHEVGYLNFTYRYFLRIFYKLIKADRKIVLFQGTKMLIPWDSKFGTEVFLKGRKVDWGSEDLLIQFLDRQKSFIDVGANIGYYSLLAAPFSHKVYSFEPDLRVIKDLEKNLSQFQNSQIIQEALYSEPGRMELNLNSIPEFNSLVRKSSTGVNKKVKVNTLDNLMSEYPSLNVSCIKIDAEGADFEILLGGKNLLIRDRPLILTEANPNAKLLNFIESIEYSCFGFAKPKDRRKSHLPAKFIKIKKHTHVNYRLKMIFLVPARLLSEFEKLVEE